MNESSLGKFHYALRPAKNIERKMFCEAFARLSRIAPLPTYRYIGFGSNEFCDFRLFHERLGIKD
ncbi:MAG: O-methyltransferase, partial [bacterium]